MCISPTSRSALRSVVSNVFLTSCMKGESCIPSATACVLPTSELWRAGERATLAFVLPQKIVSVLGEERVKTVVDDVGLVHHEPVRSARHFNDRRAFLVPDLARPLFIVKGLRQPTERNETKRDNTQQQHKNRESKHTTNSTKKKVGLILQSYKI